MTSEPPWPPSATSSGVGPAYSTVVVDDAADLRAIVKARLRVSSRFDVVGEAGDGLEAVELARRLRPALVILDVSMPRMDGLEALPAILAASPGTRVVMFSGFEERSLAEAAGLLGAVGFVEKSVPIAQLPHLLESLLGTDPAPGACLPFERTEEVRAACSGASSSPSPPAQRVLDEHLERFGEVFEDAAIGMATMTLAGRIVRANRAMAEALATSLDRLVGMQYTTLIDRAGTDAVAAALAGFGEPTAHSAVRVRHEIATGHGARHVLSTLAPVLDSKGRALYIFLQVQDLTAELAATEELHHSEQRFRLLVEAVQDYAIFMLDPAGYVASWNAGAQRIKGYTGGEIIGQHFRVFYPPEQQAIRHPENELEIALREGRYEEEGWRIRKDGSRFWALVVITAVRDAEGNHIGFGKVTRDVTERRRLLEELESANERLSRAAAEQSAFLGITAHELRGPISVLAGSADLLVAHLDALTPAERRAALDSMHTSAVRLRRLLADLITVSRLEAGKMELEISTVEVLPLLAAATAAARQQFGDVAIEVECDPHLSVDGDPIRLAQMLDNLVTNAVRHGAPPVRLQARNGDGTVQILVQDAGAGVPDEIRPRLFGRFTTSTRNSGSGLGLFIVARAGACPAWRCLV